MNDTAISCCIIYLGITVRRSQVPFAGSGVWSRAMILAGTVFGPYEGVREGKMVKGRIVVSQQVKDAGYAWEVGFTSFMYVLQLH